LLKHTSRNNLGLEHKRPQLQPYIIRKVALVTTFNLVSQELISQAFSTVPALLPALFLPYQPFNLGNSEHEDVIVTSASS